MENCSLTDDLLMKEDTSESLRLLSLIILIIIPTYTIFCVGIFLYYRNTSYWLYKRNLTMLLCFAIGSVATLIHPLRHFLGAQDFDCQLLNGISLLIFFFIFLPFVTRLANILLRVAFNLALIEYNFISVNDGTFIKSVPIGHHEFVKSSNKQPQRKESRPPSGFVSHTFAETRSKLYNCFISTTYIIFCWKPPESLPPPLRFKCFCSLYRVSNTFFAVTMIFLIALSTLRLRIFENCIGCVSDKTLINGTALCVGLLCFGLIVIYCNRHVPDGLGVKHEMKLISFVVLGTEFIFIPLYSIFNDFEEEGKFCWTFYAFIQLIGILTISFPYQVYLAKRQKKRNTNETKPIEDILDCEHGSKAFALYLATNLCLENIYFIKSVESWKIQCETNDIDELANSALYIYEKYICYSGSFVVNISYEVRVDLEERIKNEDFDANMFDSAVDAVINLLQPEIYPNFKASAYYAAYMGNLSSKDLFPR